MRPKSLFSIVALLIILCARSTYQLPRMLDNLNNENGYDNLKSQEQNNMNSWHVAADEALQGGTTCDPQTISASFIPVCNGGGDTTTCQPLYANAQMGSPNQQQQQQQQQSQQPLQAQTPQQQQQQDQYPQQQQQHQQQQQQQQQFPQQSQQQQPESDDSEQRSKELRILVQHLYVAQARVQLEATEIHKAQAVATSAQALLEESANHVRTITATLHNAQQEVAAAAIRAQIAQLQLAAHDQLLFAARQDVDSLSSQVVGLQAAEGIVQPKLTVDLHALLEKLRQPLQSYDRPTPVPMIITLPTPAGGSMGMVLSGDGNNNKDLVKQV